MSDTSRTEIVLKYKAVRKNWHFITVLFNQLLFGSIVTAE